MKKRTVLQIIQLSKTEYDITCDMNGIDAHLRKEKGLWVMDIFNGKDHIQTINYDGLYWALILGDIVPVGTL